MVPIRLSGHWLMWAGDKIYIQTNTKIESTILLMTVKEGLLTSLGQIP